jgi:hypothetical protein
MWVIERRQNLESLRHVIMFLVTCTCYGCAPFYELSFPLTFVEEIYQCSVIILLQVDGGDHFARFTTLSRYQRLTQR